MNRRFEDSNLTLHAPDNSTYDIGLVPSRLAYSDEVATLYTVPQTPHVFTADYYHVIDPERPDAQLLGSTDVTVLYTHGQWNGDAWVPVSTFLQKKGLTVARIILDYEQKTGREIDVVQVCKSGATSEIADTLDDEVGHPTVHAAFGPVAGRVYKNAFGITAETMTRVKTRLGEGEIAFNAWRKYRGLNGHSS